jgi:SAM-dependent methyltransferase
MPTLEQNLESWNRTYDWAAEGEEWSKAWGGSESQWYGAIFPRVHAFLPSQTILEIGPGFGRWTNYLRAHAEQLIAVDMSQTCIDACRRRFGPDTNIRFHINDGKSLAMIPDRSIDFAFSFDSLVHAEADVVQGYLSQLAAKLKPNGSGFIHHSNLGQYRRVYALTRRMPDRLCRPLIRIGAIDHTTGAQPA